MNRSNKLFTCYVCESTDLEFSPNYGKLPRVSSDCSPFRDGGKLATCCSCRFVQNPTDEQWHAEVNEIYNNYSIYQQSAANSEQIIFNVDKISAPRSLIVLQRASEYLNFQGNGRLLDFGCGNGALLKTVSQLAPGWTMTGFELNSKHSREIESIKGVTSFEYGALDRVDGCFDLITLHHVLEHLPNPLYWLAKIKEKLLPDGFLLIQLPDVAANPFDLIVADHCSHFRISTLSQIVKRAGYEIVVATNNWVSRELSVLACHSKISIADSLKMNTTETDEYSTKLALQWLEETANAVREASQQRPFGIFGSAIAATWLYSIVESDVDFFVDEDINKIGQYHLQKLILAPNQAPSGSQVFIGLSSPLCDSVKERLSDMPFSCYAPPPCRL